MSRGYLPGDFIEVSTITGTWRTAVIVRQAANGRYFIRYEGETRPHHTAIPSKLIRPRSDGLTVR